MKRESWSYKIRSWLATQDGTRYADEIALAVGHEGGDKFYTMLGTMVTAGLLVREKREGVRRTLYGLGRPLMTVEYNQKTERERLDSRKAKDEARRRRQGRRPLAEYLADIAKRREERARLKVKAPRPPKVAPPQPKAEPKNEWMKAGKGAIRNHLATVDAPANVAPERIETVEEWMARTGAKPERVLSHWEVSRG